MGTAVKGKDKLVYIDDGAGTVTEVPYQGDARYNRGLTNQVSKTKNGKHGYQTDEGASISFSFEKERPALAIHTRLRTLSETGETTACEYNDKYSGGESISGNVTVTLGEEESNTEGVLVQPVTLNFVDDPVVGNVA